MSDVKTAVRTLRTFEAFAANPSPMTLSELVAKLDVPPSSCLLLIRTLLGRGYLYEVGRNTYYPTGRMLEFCQEIAIYDPIIPRIAYSLEQLRDETGETVALAKQHNESFIYLFVVESRQAIRAIAKVGTLRPLHATSTGKALLSLLSPEERSHLLAQKNLEKFTDRTMTTPGELDADISRSKERGWFLGVGESFTDLAAVSVPLQIAGSSYAVTVMGPAQRIVPNADRHAVNIRNLIATLDAGNGRAAAGHSEEKTAALTKKRLGRVASA